MPFEDEIEVTEDSNTLGGTESAQSAPNADAGLDVPSGTEDDAAPNADAGLDVPSGTEKTVDELEGQLSQLQVAMDQIQDGDLDGAEATIEALESQTGLAASEEE